MQSSPTESVDERLDARYGRSKGATRRTRWIAASVAGAFVLVIAAWVVWGALSTPQADIEAKDVGHRVIDERSVEVSYQLTIAPGTETKCAAQALNEEFAVVGWKIVDVPASEERVRVLQETVLTTELANTGLIYRCWPA